MMKTKIKIVTASLGFCILCFMSFQCEKSVQKTDNTPKETAELSSEKSDELSRVKRNLKEPQ